MYAVNRGRWGSRGHTWTTTYAKENVRWDDIIMRNKNKAVTDNWDDNKDGLYNSVIEEAMNVPHFNGLKLNHKLICPLEERNLPTRGEAGYDPSRKYRKICYVPNFNLNCIIKRGGKDIVINKTTWLNKSPADMQGRTKGEKTTKGGQHVLVVDDR